MTNHQLDNPPEFSTTNHQMVLYNNPIEVVMNPRLQSQTIYMNRNRKLPRMQHLIHQNWKMIPSQSKEDFDFFMELNDTKKTKND